MTTNLAVVAKGLVVGYGRHIAIDRSDFVIPAGTVTALIGPNGSGKSTLLSAVAGLLAPISGSITVLGGNGNNRRVAYVLQATKVNEVLPITVQEVVTMGRYSTTGPWRRLSRDDREAVADAMSRMGIDDLADRHLGELSGGQRQRVFVAQGLAQEHDLLLLDEPLTGLDLVSAQAIDRVIHDEPARGCTLVMTTHDLAEARMADYVILLAGRVVAAGLPDDVLSVEHLTAAYGSSLLHTDGEKVFIDDPAHRPVPGRHVHREMTIHVEPPDAGLHGPD
ncbi:MAG TPA: zinc ABC transporter ATP-binding protein AztA [Acidimicrobiia bacterium]|nr:zinc ABC transporter ATP-binding protein AztA [Acidimicrobiia bacterium]